MPSIDMSDVLLDPDFMDTFTFVSTTRSVATGFPVDTAADPVTVSAIVIPDPSNLTRQPDGSYMSAAITIYTMVKLTAGSKTDDSASRLADVVTWHGSDYTVRAVQDYSAFGPGFWIVNADLATLATSS